MTLMFIYGSLHTQPNQKEILITDDKAKFLKTFKSTEVTTNYYNYCVAMEDHNAYQNYYGTKHGFIVEET